MSALLKTILSMRESTGCVIERETNSVRIVAEPPRCIVPHFRRPGLPCRYCTIGDSSGQDIEICRWFGVS